MIVNCQRRVPLSLKKLGEFCERARSALQFPADSVTIRLVSDPAIARLNRNFRGKRGPTDVLSFPANRRRSHRSNSRKTAKSRGDARGEYVGDIAISPQTALRNARGSARSLFAELRVLILHGMIHLAGYDHETDQGQMERFERGMRRRLGLR